MKGMLVLSGFISLFLAAAASDGGNISPAALLVWAAVSALLMAAGVALPRYTGKKQKKTARRAGTRRTADRKSTTHSIAHPLCKSKRGAVVQ